MDTAARAGEPQCEAGVSPHRPLSVSLRGREGRGAPGGAGGGAEALPALAQRPAPPAPRRRRAVVPRLDRGSCPLPASWSQRAGGGGGEQHRAAGLSPDRRGGRRIALHAGGVGRLHERAGVGPPATREREAALPRGAPVSFGLARTARRLALAGRPRRPGPRAGARASSGQEPGRGGGGGVAGTVSPSLAPAGAVRRPLFEQPRPATPLDRLRRARAPQLHRLSVAAPPASAGDGRLADVRIAPLLPFGGPCRGGGAPGGLSENGGRAGAPDLHGLWCRDDRGVLPHGAAALPRPARPSEDRHGGGRPAPHERLHEPVRGQRAPGGASRGLGAVFGAATAGEGGGAFALRVPRPGRCSWGCGYC